MALTYKQFNAAEPGPHRIMAPEADFYNSIICVKIQSAEVIMIQFISYVFFTFEPFLQEMRK
jgi:hypothetical protein